MEKRPLKHCSLCGKSEKETKYIVPKNFNLTLVCNECERKTENNSRK